MNLERVRRREFLRACAACTVALTVGPPLLHFESTLRVIGALLGKGIDCGKGVEPQNLNYPFDAIAVPGSAIVKAADGTDVPDDREKIRLEAAAIAYLNKLAPIIILLNGEKKRVEDRFIERKYLQNFYKNLTQDKEEIPDESILSDEHSINTATNMEELAKIIAKNYGRKVVMITNDFHMNRAVQFACNNGVATSPLSAESVVVYQNPTRAEAVRTMDGSLETNIARVKEAFEVGLTSWDPNGIIPTLAKGFIR